MNGPGSFHPSRGRTVVVAFALFAILTAGCGVDVRGLDDAGASAHADATGLDAADAGPADIGRPDTGPECVPVGDERAFPVLGLLQCDAMLPGESRDFDLHLEFCCYYIEPIEACETWRIEPEVPGVEIDDAGRVTVASNVPAGTEFRVIAELGDGTDRRALTTVEVYDPKQHPFSGSWSSSEAIRCEDGQRIESWIGEIVFCGSRFDVTFIPFEVYKDYWGRYDYDPTSGAIRFDVTGGNQTPPPAQDLAGTARTTDVGLFLEELSLGSRTATAAICGHVLTER